MQHTAHICKNCGYQFSGNYCNQCGEKVYTEHDKSISHLAEEGLHFVSHFDGTLLTTIKTIFTKPRQLALDYCNGVRKKYFRPLSFFLLLVVFYLVFPLLSGLNMSLYYHSVQWYHGYATQKITQLIAAKHITFDALSEQFHAISEKVSKFLLLIIIPVMALVNWALTYKRRPLYFDQFIFATENTSFFLMWGFMLLPLLLIGIGVLLQLFKIHITGDDFGELVVGICIVSGFCIYLTKAAKRFYNFSSAVALLFSIFYAITLVAFIQYIYKFILFVITINLIHR